MIHEGEPEYDARKSAIYIFLWCSGKSGSISGLTGNVSDEIVAKGIRPVG
jgi:hypothetical protein